MMVVDFVESYYWENVVVVYVLETAAGIPEKGEEETFS